LFIEGWLVAPRMHPEQVDIYTIRERLTMTRGTALRIKVSAPRMPPE